MNLNLPEKRVYVGPATMWKRVLAFMLDLLILDFFVLSVFKGLMGRLSKGMSGFADTYSMLNNNPAQAQAIVMLFMLLILFLLVYFVLLQYLTGQTIGFMLFNIRVVSQEGEKKFGKAGFWQCVLRNLFFIPAIPFILLWVIDPLYLVFAKKGQRLTEWLSNTKVIEQFTI